MEDGDPVLWRHVGKREFGEVCRPEVPVSTEDGEEWKPLPLVGSQQEGSVTAPSTLEE